MANNRQQEQQNALLAEAKQLMSDINRLRVQVNQEPLNLSEAEAVRGIQSLRNELKSLQRELADVDGTATNLFEQLQGVAKEFGAVLTPAKGLKNAFKGMVSEAAKLKNDELGLIDLRTRDLEKLQEKMKVLNEQARVSAGQFSDQRASYDKVNDYLEEEAEKRQEILEIEEKIAAIQVHDKITEHERNELAAKRTEKEEELLNLQIKRKQEASKVSDEANAAFQYLDDQNSVYNGIQRKITQRLETEKEISRLSGVTGALVEGTGALMERLGMRSGIFHDAMREAAQEIRQMAKDTANGVKNFSKLDIAAKGFSTVVKGFGQGLLDPAAAVGAIVDGFFKVDSSATKLQRLTGQNSRSIAGMNSRLATSVDFLETAAELTLQTGMNAQNVFSDDVLAGAAELKNVMGLAADEAGGLAMIAQTTSGDIDQVTDSIVETTSAFNRSNRSAVSQGLVLRDVAKTSDSIKASFSGMPDELAKAAAAARRMGMDLNKLDQIASSLLDFESSIEAELEAQLLTGNRINLAKAREFALTNKLKEVGEEIFKNSVSLNEFGRMNRIQQEAQAKALGLTRDELGRIAYKRALELGMTEKQAEAAGAVTAENMKILDAQEAIQQAVAKLQQAFAPLLTVVAELANLVAPMIAGLAKFFATPIGKIVAVSYALNKAFGLVNLNIKGMVKNLGQFISKSAIAEKIMNNLGGSRSVAGSLAGKGKDSAGTTVTSSKKSAGGLKSLTGAIQKINVKSLLAGAAAMAVAAGSIFIFAKASQEFADVSWSDIGKATVGLIALVGAVTALGAIMSSGVGAVAILAGAAAIGIIAGSLYVLGAAIEKISGGLGEIANLGSAFDFASIGIDKMAASIYKLSEALQSIETEKVEELKALVATTALAAPVVAATGAITDLIQGIAGTGDAGTDTETIKKLDAILAAIKEGGDVYLDSSKVGQALAMGSYKSS